MGSSAVAVSSSVCIFPLATPSFLPLEPGSSHPGTVRRQGPPRRSSELGHPIRRTSVSDFTMAGPAANKHHLPRDFNGGTSLLPQPCPLPRRTRSVRLSSPLHPPPHRAKRLENVPERPKSKPRHAPCQAVLASAVFLELRACVCARVRAWPTVPPGEPTTGAELTSCSCTNRAGTHETRLACDVREKRTKRQQRGCVVWDLSRAWPRCTARLALGLRWRHTPTSPPPSIHLSARTGHRLAQARAPPPPPPPSPCMRGTEASSIPCQITRVKMASASIYQFWDCTIDSLRFNCTIIISICAILLHCIYSDTLYIFYISIFYILLLLYVYYIFLCACISCYTCNFSKFAFHVIHVMHAINTYNAFITFLMCIFWLSSLLLPHSKYPHCGTNKGLSYLTFSLLKNTQMSRVHVLIRILFWGKNNKIHSNY